MEQAVCLGEDVPPDQSARQRKGPAEAGQWRQRSDLGKSLDRTVAQFCLPRLVAAITKMGDSVAAPYHQHAGWCGVARKSRRLWQRDATRARRCSLSLAPAQRWSGDDRGRWIKLVFAANPMLGQDWIVF